MSWIRDSVGGRIWYGHQVCDLQFSNVEKCLFGIDTKMLRQIALQDSLPPGLAQHVQQGVLNIR
jgi:hypothetical protein